jgi:hypothetical protein
MIIETADGKCMNMDIVFDSLNYNSDRLLRILGSGATCVSYNHKGMQETYKNTAVYFNDFEELKNKIDYFLNNNYGLDGEFFVKDNFTFKHQVENIIKLAK